MFHLSHKASYHIRPVCIIPKTHLPWRYCLIVDVTPKHYSVNNVTDSNWCSLTYANLDHAAALVNKLGKGSLLAKLEFQSASEVFQYAPKISHFWLTSLNCIYTCYHSIWLIICNKSVQHSGRHELYMPGNVIGYSPPWWLSVTDDLALIHISLC